MSNPSTGAQEFFLDEEHQDYFDQLGQGIIQEELQHRRYLRQVGQFEAYQAQQDWIIERGRQATRSLDGMEFEEAGSQADLWTWPDQSQ